MTQLDIFYRALIDYRKQTKQHRECAAQRGAVAKADAARDKLVMTRTSCVVDEDWIGAIEEGLPFIGKAIDEERQFIRSNGEVEPIEKVKHTSRESVEHLARHSNFITREQQGEDVVPDRLYTVERLNDYTVYENRFLYMVLCYLRDFVSLRYNKILELTNTYTGDLVLDKTVNFGKQRISYQASLNEERKDDPYLREHNPSKSAIDRIDLVLRSVYFYLHTPLMTEVGKVDKLKPPISKTNVLRMDKNFKRVVELYEFIIAYNKDGFTVVKEEKSLAPFREDIADELAETVLLASFLAYEHGLGLEEELAVSYANEEQRRREEEERKKLARIEAFRRGIAEEGVTPEEYMLLLEERNRKLEADSEELKLRRAEIEKQKETIASLEGRIREHQNEVAMLNEMHGKEVFELNGQIESLRQEGEAEREAHRAAMREAESRAFEEIARIDRECREKIAEEEKQVEAAHAETEEKQRALDYSNARLNALRSQYGLVGEDEDFTTEASFDELEREYIAFRVFYDKQWKKTKRRIRRELLKATFRSIWEQIRASFASFVASVKSAKSKIASRNAPKSAEDAEKEEEETEQTGSAAAEAEPDGNISGEEDNGEE